MKLVFGLGNPGAKYAATRHNAGFMVVDLLASRHGIAIDGEKHKGLTGRGTIGGEEVTLSKPQTFMNLSGEAVAPLVAYIDCTPKDIIVVHDDLDLDYGTLRVKSSGGHGGHNGLRSIMAHLGTGDFTRVRVGIGRPIYGGDVTGHVLGSFTPDERGVLPAILDRGAEAVEAILDVGILKAMNLFNR